LLSVASRGLLDDAFLPLSPCALAAHCHRALDMDTSTVVRVLFYL
jgi:hypothetical protein